MLQAQKREVAHRAVRARLRSVRIAPEMCSPDEALRVIDELASLEPDLIASQWYRQASDHQVGLFWQEWRTWAYNRKLENQLFLPGNGRS